MESDNLSGMAVLTDDQTTVVEEAASWVSNSMAAVGQAYLEHEAARARFELAKKTLDACVATARASNAEHDEVMASISKALDLSPGRWMYDGKGKLVKEKI